MKKSIFAVMAIVGALASAQASAQESCNASCLTGVDSLALNIVGGTDGGAVIDVLGGTLVVDAGGTVQSNSTGLSGAALARAVQNAIDKVMAQSGSGAVPAVLALKEFLKKIGG